jgi:D-alanine-D-alanine ligase
MSAKKDKPLDESTILLLNIGEATERFILERIKKLVGTVIAVNRDQRFPRRLVDHFIKADTNNHRKVIEKVQAFKDENPLIKIDGAVCFWEEDIPAHARIVEHFNLIGNSYRAAINTRNKYEMRRRLRNTGLGSAEFCLVKNHRDLAKAMTQIGFPAVMKPVWGSDSEFVVLVRDEDEARSTLDYLIKNATEEFSSILKFNSGNFLYEEYIDGVEMSLECYSQYGIPHVVGIHEKAPVTPPYFIECGDFSPARLTKTQADEVTKLAESSLIALGVKNSVAHIELKWSSKGPKIIEVASRMGGDDIHLYTKHVFGEDLIKIALQIACGIKVDVKKEEPVECLIAKYFLPQGSGIVTNITGLQEVKKNKNVLNVVIKKDVGDTVLSPPEGFENIGWVLTRGKSYEEAQRYMEEVFNDLDINVTRFSKGSYLGKSNRKEELSYASLVRGQIMRAAKIGKIRTLNLDALKQLNFGILTNSEVPLIDDSIRESKLGEEIQFILEQLDYKVSLFDMSENPLPIKRLLEANLDFVLNLCEALHNSTYLESHAAAFLDVLQLPYSGSGPATMSLCADKITIKKLLAYHQIPTPSWDYLYMLDDEIRSDLNYPLIVKPANTDNSYGITNDSVVTNRAELNRELEKIIEGYKRPALIEEYIEGDEFDVCVLGNDEDLRVLPVVRSDFEEMPQGYWHIYGSDPPGKSGADSPYERIRWERPARITEKLSTLLGEIALDAYSLFGFQDYGKVEFRVDKAGNPYVLEVNPNPPLDRDSIFATSAEGEGLTYEKLLEELIFIAARRYKDMEWYDELLAVSSGG